MKTKPTKIFVVIPIYNESSKIEDVINGVQKYTKNIIVVDDGSKDDSGDLIRKHDIILLRHRMNLGKGAAMKTGAEAAFRMGADVVIFVDGDGQHDPKHIPDFIKTIGDNNDIVFGSRNLSYGVPLVRFLGNKFGSILINLTFGIYRSDLLCGYIALTKYAYDKIRWDSPRYGVETEIVAKTGKYKLRYGEIPMEAIYLDKFKGVTLLDAIVVLFNIPRWKLLK